MRVLVTGAGGFLGRHIVSRLRARGHGVRAVVRERARAGLDSAADGVEIVAADLRCDPLDSLLEGIDAVVHAATTMVGDDFTIFSGSVVGTERLFAALARAKVRRLVLVSSFSVYDWLDVRGRLRDDSPLLARPWAGGGYAAAKVWQERLADRLARDHGVSLTVLRPGFIWAPDGPMPACFGMQVGRAFLVFGPLRRPPLTHVINCADCVAQALDSPAAGGRTFNVVDEQNVTSWGWIGARQRAGNGGVRVPLPHLAVRSLVWLIDRIGTLVFGPSRKLPSFCEPLRHHGRFGAVRCDRGFLRDVLRFEPPLPTFEACLGAPAYPDGRKAGSA